jgi:hypothetical protein
MGHPKGTDHRHRRDRVGKEQPDHQPGAQGPGQKPQQKQQGLHQEAEGKTQGAHPVDKQNESLADGLGKTRQQGNPEAHGPGWAWIVNIAEGLGLQPQRTPDHAAESSQRIAQHHGSLNTMVGNGTRPAARALIQRRIS